MGTIGAVVCASTAPAAGADGPRSSGIVTAAPVDDQVIRGAASGRTALEVRSVRSESFGLAEAKVSSYRARASVRLTRGSGALVPYAGLGLGLQLVEGESASTVRGQGVGVGRVDIGAGANAFLGLRIPVGLQASVFAEGRAGLANDLGQGQRDRLRIDGRGDYSGFAGLRWAF
jgi:hypothetical protein